MLIRILSTAVIAGFTGVAGYVGGIVYPAPPEWTDAVNRQAGEVRAKFALNKIDLNKLKQMIPQAQLNALKSEAASGAVDAAYASGQAIQVEQDSGTLEEQLDNLAISKEQALAMAARPAAPAAATPGAAPATPPQAFDANLALCPRMKIENAPPTATVGTLARVQPFAPIVKVKGVAIATDPTRGACLSSGFGSRDMRLHKGVDYHSETGGPILAAGDGEVIEMKYRDDYGNMILIDHGNGVYTRYAHLASFGKGLMTGVTVKAGEQIGLMGNTAAYPVPIHLHYEVLVGDYKTQKASFGLDPVNVFKP